MRTARTINNTENSFEQGVKQIVREKSARPTRYADYELNAITRREQHEATLTPVRTPTRGYSISDLMQELIWKNPVFGTRSQ